MHTSTVRDDALLESATHDADLHALSEVIEHAGHLLPAQGPITVFIHHNTLHAFEDLPFNAAVKKGAHVFGCQPYLSEDRYRQELRRGRIRFAELKEALEHDLGDRAGEKVPCFGTRLDLRLAMLQNPLRTGPTDELVWYVAEANALRRIRRDVSAADRARLIAETRRWVIRDLRGFGETSRNGSSEPEGDRRIPDSLAELLFRFGKSKMEYWSDEDWEGLTLQALWRVCCDGVRDIPAFTTPAPLAIRHRDVLLEATGVDTDLLVDDRLIPFSAAFLDQGFAHWELPRRDEGFYRCLLLLVPPALGTAGPLDARACRRGWPPAGRGDRTAGIGPGITQDPRCRQGGVGAVPVRHVAGTPGLGRNGPPDRGSRRPRGSPRAPGQPCRVPGDPASAGPIRGGLHGPNLTRDQDSGQRVLAPGPRVGRSTMAAQRRTAGLPCVPVGPDLRSVT